jgi:hypothetical protein
MNWVNQKRYYLKNRIRMNKDKTTYNSADLYQYFVQELLKNNPNYWSKKTNGRRKSRIPNAYIYTKQNGQVIEVFSFSRWTEVVKLYHLLGRKKVIDGHPLPLGANLGDILGRTISRFHGKKAINFSETKKQPMVLDPETGKMKRERIIYYDSDTYCRIAWKKLKRITNERIYKFQAAQGNAPGKGFTGEFSTALREDPILYTRFEQKLTDLI